MVIALFISIIVSGANPIFGWMLCEMLFVLLVPTSPTYIEDRDFWCGMILLVAGIFAITSWIQYYVFTYAGENIILALRKKLFEGIIYKQIAWFDNKSRAPGILTQILAEDITEINGMTANTLGLVLEGVSGLIVGTIIAFIFSWKMALIGLGFLPFLLVGSYQMAKMLMKKPKTMEANKEDDKYEISNALLSDVIMNYRTVISFGDKNIRYLINKYEALLEGPNKENIRSAHKAGGWFAYSTIIRFVYIAIAFYVASIFVFKKGEKPDDVFKAVFVMFITVIGAGMTLSQAADIGRAKASARKIFDIIDEKSTSDVREAKGIKKVEKGEIELVDVNFKYPSR